MALIPSAAISTQGPSYEDSGLLLCCRFISLVRLRFRHAIEYAIRQGANRLRRRVGRQYSLHAQQ